MNNDVTMNAQIHKVELLIEDHKLRFNLWATLESGIRTNLCGIKFYDDCEYQPKFATFLHDLMNVVDVQDFSQLQGKYIRVKTTPRGLVIIGNILTNCWMMPTKYINKEGMRDEF